MPCLRFLGMKRNELERSEISISSVFFLAGLTDVDDAWLVKVQSSSLASPVSSRLSLFAGTCCLHIFRDRAHDNRQE